jgi:hypothetical protein
MLWAGSVSGNHGNYLLLRNVVTYAENLTPNMGPGEFKFIRLKSRLVSSPVKLDFIDSIRHTLPQQLC